MISNEHPCDNKAKNEQTLKVEKIQIERKTFVFSLKENSRGRFIRITEDVGKRHNSVIVPLTGFGEFKNALIAIVRDASKPAQGASI